MRRTIGVTFKGNGGHSDDRAFGKPLFQIVIFRLAFGEAKPPAIIMDHDADMIRIVEGAALRSNVASSKSHFGEAICQMSWQIVPDLS